MAIAAEKRAITGGNGRARYRLLYLLKRSYTVAKLGLDDVVREHGLSASDFTLLSFLRQLEPCSAADLARAQNVTPQATTQQVAQLKAKQLVVSEASPVNRRISLITMTPLGRARLAEVSKQARRLEDEMMAGLSDAERTALIGLLGRMIETVEHKENEDADVG
ncbi:MarR family winged helix-turn-helix transcriptional regulator [Sphingobium lignivorans]|uniref:DNA-binding MarR family transcriptional regulator n=1 Tax=Sphingobium lignivorans TaxID=2735886 RepID=A0ABR6NBX8_9SPHN|nr:MarR family transcriptional regulator [Sphingobium lignivorans]MBB5984785.1 DNA-binding MarR family transcriptional regulator [Sphingobium lignivorans]